MYLKCSKGNLIVKWDLNHLQEYLINNGRIKDRNWLKSEFYP
jgi:hypothetical protein